jgi:hypothetical protein
MAVRILGHLQNRKIEHAPNEIDSHPVRAVDA